MNEVITSTTINGSIVARISTVDGYEVYQEESANGESVTLFFTKKNKVVFKIDVSADCGQNTGFISHIAIGKVHDN